jgi:regulator of replication initiation timing
MIDLLQKVEEKVLVLLIELENLRNEVNSLKYENANLKIAQNNQLQKLQGLVSLLNVLEANSDSTVVQMESVPA